MNLRGIEMAMLRRVCELRMRPRDRGESCAAIVDICRHLCMLLDSTKPADKRTLES